MKVKLSNEKLRHIALFEKLTGVTPRDFVVSGDGKKFTFIVDEGEMGKAIGKNGKNIGKIREKLEKSVNVVEYSEDIEKFLENILSPAEIKEVKIEGGGDEKKIVLEVDSAEKGRVVGRNGWNIERARKLMDRHFGVSEVSIA